MMSKQQREAIRAGHLRRREKRERVEDAARELVRSPWPAGSVERESCERALRAAIDTLDGVLATLPPAPNESKVEPEP